MGKKTLNTAHGVICGILIFQLIGCGTIMYPERKGQRGGKIDPGVAILDGIGLLFFLVPGIIAFAVDFNNGTIYLPGTARGPITEDNMKQVRFDPKQSTQEDIERIIAEHTGTNVKLNQRDMNITELTSTDEISEQFAEVLPGMRDTRIAVIR
jgi:hypothetical protein